MGEEIAIKRARRNAIMRRYRQKNLEKVLAYERGYATKKKSEGVIYPSRTKCGLYSATYRTKHPEKVKATQARYRERNREQRRITQKLRRGNPEAKMKHRLESSKRRAIAKNQSTKADFKLIAKWCAQWSKGKAGKCYWCKSIEKTSVLHMDHIVALSVGGSHIISNLCLSCAPCNHRKGAKTIDQWNLSLLEPVLL